MALLGFNKENAQSVALGWKRQTIRRTRHDIYPGKRLQLYGGLRTRDCRKLWPSDPCCTRKAPIVIDVGEVVLDGLLLNDAAIASLARADGFFSEAAFYEFFRKEYKLPFGVDGRGAEVVYW